MTEPTAAQEQHSAPQPSEALRRLNRLVGTWQVTDEAQGQVRYEWLEGGFFLIQHVDLEHSGTRHRGIEMIGHERGFGAEAPGEDIKSRYYDNQGNTLDYVYELQGATLTIWGGERGSPAFFRGTFNADDSVMTGGWEWPGGGYRTTMTRISR